MFLIKSGEKIDVKNIENIPLNIDEYIGQKLRKFREDAGLSTIECSKQLGIADQKIYKYEAGQAKISPSVLYKFCKLFSVFPNAFFDGYSFSQENDEFYVGDIITQTQPNKIHILLIEYDTKENPFVKKILSEYNLKINSFKTDNGEKFLNEMKKQVNKTPLPFPDLIFLDIDISQCHWIELLKMLKKSSQMRHIPVIVVIRSMGIQNVVNAYEHHANGCMYNLLDYETLKKQIYLAICYWTEGVISPTQLNVKYDQVG